MKHNTVDGFGNACATNLYREKMKDTTRLRKNIVLPKSSTLFVKDDAVNKAHKSLDHNLYNQLLVAVISTVWPGTGGNAHLGVLGVQS